MRLDEKLIEKVRNAVEVEYDSNATKEDIENMLKDLLNKIGDLEYEIEELQFEYNVGKLNERDFDPYDEYGVSPHDFY